MPPPATAGDSGPAGGTTTGAGSTSVSIPPVSQPQQPTTGESSLSSPSSVQTNDDMSQLVQQIHIYIIMYEGCQTRSTLIKFSSPHTHQIEESSKYEAPVGWI
ncbi:unnamed protein product [Allacma fusca]|uniref:Uncharacterized protein n=1 Tax=Allacma fusca TaxID=39272 RepID=A0A8J2KYP3_9HEXA|nr:unnamed protein product [Allacma fusca]